MSPPGAVPLSRVTSVLRAAGLLAEDGAAEDVVVRGVSQDSRAVGDGDLFLAWEGATTDAHDFVADAALAGAAAAVVERRLDDVALPQVVVTDGRRAGALAADLVQGSPWRSLFVVGITGTNGKTTTALLLRHVLGLEGPSAAVGTLGLVGPEGSVRSGTEGLTTPGPVQLSRWLRELADEGVRAVAMEASSHALDQHRLDGIRFDVAVFTNLSQDHLDYHATLDAYFEAKARLLELLAEDGVAVVNAGDPAWDRLARPERTVTFVVGGEREADLVALDVRSGAAGSTFTLAWNGDERTVDLPLLGRFNVENALAAAGAALAGGQTLAAVVAALEEAPQVTGRLEMVVRKPFTVVIDFAHTPAALRGVLAALRPLAGGRLIVLFGAGGDRDRGKRRPMAEAVAAYADAIVLTSDNPRTEDPEAILDDLAAGLEGHDFERLADRREAIGRAVAMADAGDLVLLAGKGHETYQVVGEEKHPFDERVVVREAMARRGVA